MEAPKIGGYYRVFKAYGSSEFTIVEGIARIESISNFAPIPIELDKVRCKVRFFDAETEQLEDMVVGRYVDPSEIVPMFK